MLATLPTILARAPFPCPWRQRVEAERWLSCRLGALPPHLCPTSTTATNPSTTAHLSILASLPWTDANTLIFPLAKWKGNIRGYKSKQEESMLVNKIHATKKLHVCCAVWGKRGGVLNSKHLALCLHVHLSFLGSLSLCQDNSCVSCSWAVPGNQILHVSITILPREITHLELKHDHKLLGISDC